MVTHSAELNETCQVGLSALGLELEHAHTVGVALRRDVGLAPERLVLRDNDGG